MSDDRFAGNNQSNAISSRVILQMSFFVIVAPFLPLLISRHWDWWEAWAYAGIAVLGFASSRLLAARVHPDLLAERARFLQHEDAKSWDKILAPLVGLGGGLISPMVAVSPISMAPGCGTKISTPVASVVVSPPMRIAGPARWRPRRTESSGEAPCAWASRIATSR